MLTMLILHPLTLSPPDQIYTCGFLFVANVELGYWLLCFPLHPAFPCRIEACTEEEHDIFTIFYQLFCN